MTSMPERSRDRTSIVFRVYIRRTATTPRAFAPHAYPGRGWEQLGTIGADREVPDEGEILVIIDVDASSRSARLRSTLPSHLHSVHFHGRTPTPPEWLKELPYFQPTAVAL